MQGPALCLHTLTAMVARQGAANVPRKWLAADGNVLATIPADGRPDSLQSIVQSVVNLCQPLLALTVLCSTVKSFFEFDIQLASSDAKAHLAAAQKLGPGHMLLRISLAHQQYGQRQRA